MTPFWQTSLDIVRWVQGWGDWLQPLMQALSTLGRAPFYLAVIPALYWCVDSALGWQMGLMLLISGSVNDALKMAWQQPRPYWLSQQVRALGFEASFGLPSGHAQTSASVWGLLAVRARSRGWGLALGAAILLIGISRLYLGVHFATDVLAGWLLGALVLWAFLRFQPSVSRWLDQSRLSGQVLACLAGSALLLALPAAARALMADWQMPLDWQANIQAQHGELSDPRTLENALLVAGMLLGMGLGRIALARMGGQNTGGTPIRRLARYAVGMVGLAVLWIGLGLLLPEGASIAAQLVAYLHAALVGSWIALWAPLLFQRMGLATQP